MSKLILIWDDPYFEQCLGINNARTYLETLHSNPFYTFCSTHELETICWDSVSTFVTFYGGYFPQQAFFSMEHFFKKGTGFLCFNGAPFQVPCRYDLIGKQWVSCPSSLTYLRRLNIHSALTVDSKDIVSYSPSEFSNLMDGFNYLDPKSACQNLILIPTKDKYFKNEWGSAGSMDSRIFPLIKGLNNVGEHRASPAVLLQHRAGAFSGGQWIFCTQRLSDQADTAFSSQFAKICHFLQQGYLEVILQPSQAIYHSLEMPSLRLSLQQYNSPRTVNADLTVKNQRNEIIASWHNSLNLSDAVCEQILPIENGINQGIYSVVLTLTDSFGIQWNVRQGFLHGEFQEPFNFPRFRAGHDYFLQNDTPVAIVGMTYMSGERGRAFLHLPNTDLWLREMQQMKQVGINWIRTGIWTNWRTYMLDDGHMDECMLRSLEAFVTCAAILNLHVTFTFFSFVPEMWEGTHPYLDPRCINAQKRFISHIIARLKNHQNIDWDLINEPYVTNHPTIKRTHDDVYEKIAYISYLKKKYNNSIELYTASTGFLAKSFDDLELPTPQDINFSITDVSDCKNGLIWRDYVEFSHEVFRNWVQEMKAHIKSQTNHMVTVGQDEALRTSRPVPLNYGDLLDYDAQHTWWFLQDLAWDTIFTKSSQRPLMVQETGIMYVENADGSPRRTESDLETLLRKKYAYAFATKCAGVIQWIWNSNYHLQSANESNIGALRCDGSFKPEVDVTKDFSAFFSKCRPYMSNIRKNKIAVVFPFSNDFSNRQFSQVATTTLAKIFTNYLHIGFDAISEFRIHELAPDGYDILICPAPHNFSLQARLALKKLAHCSHIKILFTGPICLDENYHQLPLEDFCYGYKPLNQWETVTFNQKTYTVSFESQIFMSAFKESFTENGIICHSFGNSTLYHLNVPVELSRDFSVLAELYHDVLHDMGYTPDFNLISTENLDSLFVSGVRWENATLYTIINECDIPKTLTLFDTPSHTEVKLKVEENAVRMFVLTTSGELAVTDDGVFE